MSGFAYRHLHFSAKCPAGRGICGSTSSCTANEVSKPITEWSPKQNAIDVMHHAVLCLHYWSYL